MEAIDWEAFLYTAGLILVVVIIPIIMIFDMKPHGSHKGPTYSLLVAGVVIAIVILSSVFGKTTWVDNDDIQARGSSEFQDP